MARSVNVKPSAREESKSSGGEEQTTVMSRALLPFPARRPSSAPPREGESARHAARSNDDKTVVDFVRPGVIQDERTLVAPFLLPKSTRQTLSIPRPSSAPTPTTCDLPVATRRASSLPPLPPPSQALANPRPALIPPPPPSATKLHPPPRSVRPSAPPAIHESRESLAPESSPALVSDVVPLPPAPASRTRREPMLLLAAGMGVLGMIFTLGIVVGLVVSLRSPAPAPAATLGTRALPVAAAAGGAHRRRSSPPWLLLSRLQSSLPRRRPRSPWWLQSKRPRLPRRRSRRSWQRP